MRSYAIKFSVKKEDGLDCGVMPLEGLWWTDGEDQESEDILSVRDSWRWTAMIMQPDPVTQNHVERAIAAISRKKDLPGTGKLRFEAFEEGRAAQILYTGPYSGEMADDRARPRPHRGSRFPSHRKAPRSTSKTRVARLPRT